MHIFTLRYQYILIILFGITLFFIIYIRKISNAIMLRLNLIVNWHSKIGPSLGEAFSGMRFRDACHAIDIYIPTRWSKDDSDSYDRTDENAGVDSDEVFLVDQIVDEEISKNNAQKVFLCLGECAAGKTTFMINLYIRLQSNHECSIVSLANINCFKQIAAINNKERTILLLDALDENCIANCNCIKFMSDLEKAISPYFKVIISCKTSFICNASISHLIEGKQGMPPLRVMQEAKKFFIKQPSDKDIELKLHQKYKKGKYKRVREHVLKSRKLGFPLFMDYLDDMAHDFFDFTYSFEIYNYVIRKQIAECLGDIDLIYDELILLAKKMYYQWTMDGVIGIYEDDIDIYLEFPHIANALCCNRKWIVNKTNGGIYRFNNRSFWEYMLAIQAIKDLDFFEDLNVSSFHYCESVLREISSIDDVDRIKGIAGFKHPLQIIAANYNIKCGRPEVAEKLLSELLASDNELSDVTRIYVFTYHIRSLRYQRKEVASRKLILDYYPYIESLYFDDDTIKAVIGFCWELAECSWRWKTTTEKKLLLKIIESMKDSKIYIRYQFKCYCALCRLEQNAPHRNVYLSDMFILLRNYRCEVRDDYVEYLTCRAYSLGRTYGGKSTRIDRLLIYKFMRFMDDYDRMLIYSWYALDIISDVSMNLYENNIDIAQDISLDYLVEIYDICTHVYPEEDYESPEHAHYCNLAYYVLMWQRAFTDYPSQKISEQIDLLYKFLRSNSSFDDAPISFLEVYKFARLQNYTFDMESVQFLQHGIDIAHKFNMRYNLFVRNVTNFSIK